MTTRIPEGVRLVFRAERFHPFVDTIIYLSVWSSFNGRADHMIHYHQESE